MTDASRERNPIKLFWWAKKPNFGDVLSRDVTEVAFGRVVEHSSVAEAEVFGLGSILHAVSRQYNAGPPIKNMRPVIWGSGLFKFLNTEFVRHCDIHLLRGPITAAILESDCTCFGDPGLLAKHAYGEVERGAHFGVLLHHTQISEEAIATINQIPNAQFIDVRRDPKTVSLEIAGCSHVFSSSLHGLIVADAYGVPNTWLTPPKGSEFKFYDYAASIERVLPRPAPLTEIASLMAIASTDTPNYINAVEQTKDLILSTATKVSI
ncbi:MAG: polysaccharide pyruvyl transferase family protein [Pseudomonadota bacterium]